MNYNTLRNKPTINYKEIIGDNTVTDVGGITEEEFDDLLDTDLASYYTKEQIDELFSRSFVYREKSGSIVTFDCPSSITTGISEVTSEIVAVQSGTGDPSPTNVRPISGWTEANVSVEGGQNLYSDSIVWKNGYYINASGVETQSNNYKYTQTFIEVDPSTTYSIQADITAGTDLAITVPYYTEAQSFISRDLVSDVNVGTRTYKVDFTTPSNCKYIRMSVPTDTSNIVIYKKYVHNIQFIVNGETKSIYSGYVEIKNGKVKAVATDENIASYNGETLPSTWISDRDVYAEGTTPTIGAQVLYKLATPIEYDLADVSISSQDGTNNLWADSGDITVKALDKIIQG